MVINIRNLREAKNWTQRQLAAALDIDQSMVSRYEKAGEAPDDVAERIEKICAPAEPLKIAFGPYSDSILLNTVMTLPDIALQRDSQAAEVTFQPVASDDTLQAIHRREVHLGFIRHSDSNQAIGGKCIICGSELYSVRYWSVLAYVPKDSQLPDEERKPSNFAQTYLEEGARIHDSRLRSLYSLAMTLAHAGCYTGDAFCIPGQSPQTKLIIDLVDWIENRIESDLWVHKELAQLFRDEREWIGKKLAQLKKSALEADQQVAKDSKPYLRSVYAFLKGMKRAKEKMPALMILGLTMRLLAEDAGFGVLADHSLEKALEEPQLAELISPRYVALVDRASYSTYLPAIRELARRWNTFVAANKGTNTVYLDALESSGSKLFLEALLHELNHSSMEELEEIGSLLRPGKGYPDKKLLARDLCFELWPKNKHLLRSIIQERFLYLALWDVDRDPSLRQRTN
ncbi:MAG: helix-turn-helix transcriptional regulator [Verrucomicrobiaceae bacterium]|nr:helix-turn-helix transcriptional regulator [Verrucomicrobiaceae bacterium]